MNKRGEHVYIAWSLFYSLILSNGGKYRLICSLIVNEVINFNFLYFITIRFAKLIIL